MPPECVIAVVPSHRSRGANRGDQGKSPWGRTATKETPFARRLRGGPRPSLQVLLNRPKEVRGDKQQRHDEPALKRRRPFDHLHHHRDHRARDHLLGCNDLHGHRQPAARGACGVQPLSPGRVGSGSSRAGTGTGCARTSSGACAGSTCGARASPGASRFCARASPGARTGGNPGTCTGSTRASPGAIAASLAPALGGRHFPRSRDRTRGRRPSFPLARSRSSPGTPTWRRSKA